MLNIIWSPLAQKDYDENIDYLLKEWGVNDALEFIREVETTLQHITKMPKMYPTAGKGKKNLRRCVVCKQISMIYRVSDSHIELVRFWDTRQDPSKLKD